MPLDYSKNHVMTLRLYDFTTLRHYDFYLLCVSRYYNGAVKMARGGGIVLTWVYFYDGLEVADAL